jgi:TraM recognition site of TraD and TraG
MEYILTNALLVLIEYPDTTLLSVNRIFNDKAYRLKVVDYCTDPAVKSFWVDEFANYTERFAAEALPAIQNKIGQFTGNPLIRNIIGQPHSSFDFRKCMDEKKIVIMNLSKGLVGETNANLLGSMLTTRIYLAAMSRADLPLAQMKVMPNYYFYVDEFQSFANATFANILSEARKYHLNLIIAHQYIEQMEEEVRDAVFGNVGTTISFRVGPFDAETLETVFTPRFLAADLVNLGFAQIYLTLMIDGIGSQPFSATTLPPIEPPSVSCKDMVIAASRRNFTKPRLEVEKIVTDLHTPEKVEKPEKKATNQNPKPYVKQAATPVSTPVNSGNTPPRTPIVVSAPSTSFVSGERIPGIQIVNTTPTPAFVSPQARQSTLGTKKDTVSANHTLQQANVVAAVKEVATPLTPHPEKTPYTKPTEQKFKREHKESREKERPARAPEQGRDVTRKLAPKTLLNQALKTEDLRSILAKTAKSSGVEKNATEPKSTAKSATPAESTFKKIETTISPLQAALAQLKKVDAENIPRVLPPLPFPIPTSFTPASVVIKTEAEKLHTEIETVFASLENKTATSAVVQEVSSVQESKVGNDSTVTTQTIPKSTPSSTTQPHSTESGLDPKHLARILRPTAPERSPFR